MSKKLRVPGRLLLAFAALALMAAPAFAEESDLGKVDFPNSGSEAAQEAFQRGVAALHSFWFEEAGKRSRTRRKSTPISPSPTGVRRSATTTHCGPSRTSAPRATS